MRARTSLVALLFWFIGASTGAQEISLRSDPMGQAVAIYPPCRLVDTRTVGPVQGGTIFGFTVSEFVNPGQQPGCVHAAENFVSSGMFLITTINQAAPGYLKYLPGGVHNNHIYVTQNYEQNTRTSIMIWIPRCVEGLCPECFENCPAQFSLYTTQTTHIIIDFYGHGY